MLCPTPCASLCERANRAVRCRRTRRWRHRRRGDEPAGGVLANLQPEPFVFDFEFRKFVLAHERKNLFDVVDIHSEFE